MSVCEDFVEHMDFIDEEYPLDVSETYDDFFISHHRKFSGKKTGSCPRTTKSSNKKSRHSCYSAKHVRLSENLRGKKK